MVHPVYMFNNETAYFPENWRIRVSRSYLFLEPSLVDYFVDFIFYVFNEIVFWQGTDRKREREE